MRARIAIAAAAVRRALPPVRAGRRERGPPRRTENEGAVAVAGSWASLPTRGRGGGAGGGDREGARHRAVTGRQRSRRRSRWHHRPGLDRDVA